MELIWRLRCEILSGASKGRAICRRTRSISKTLDAEAIVDTGPLVALMDRRDSLHGWAVDVFARIPGPYVTTEANVVEVCHLLERDQLKRSLRFYEMLATGTIRVVSFSDRLSDVQAQVARYRDRRVDYADACVLALSDEYPRLPIITTDVADFTVYLRGRGNRNFVAPTG